MDVYTVPIDDKWLIYRPLLRLAFVGNAAMVRLVVAWLERPDRLPEGLSREPAPQGLPPEVYGFLERIGFLAPDPPPPEPRDREYKPTGAVILATNRCNLRCIYCYADGGKGVGRAVTPELARVVIDRAHQNALELERSRFELTLHGGGEPTLAWDTVAAAVAYARSKELPCRIAMVSNGVWSDEQRAWILDNLDSVTISMDGSQETQDRQRPFASGKGTFPQVMATMEALDKAGFQYGVRMTALSPWRERLARDVAFLCEETGCRRMQVEPAFGNERGQYRAPTQEEAGQFVEGFMQAFATAEGAGRGLHFSGARPYVLAPSFCSAPYGGLIVTPLGDLVACYEITDREHPLAAMCSIGAVENGRIQLDRAVRKTLLDRLARRREGCRDCFCYWHCGGDCLAKAFYPGVDTAPETSTRCWMNRTITAQMLLWHVAHAEDGVWRGEARRADYSDGKAGAE
jgi:uncharacterized protein